MATVDGIELELADAGGPILDHGYEGCRQISFEPIPADQLPAGQASTIEISDDSATWTIDVAGGLVREDIVLSAPPVTDAQVVLRWQSSPRYWRPYATFTDGAGAVVATWECAYTPYHCAPIAGTPSAFTSVNDEWNFSITWKSTGNAGPPPPRTEGTLHVEGVFRALETDGIVTCTGPADCVVDVAGRYNVPATLF